MTEEFRQRFDLLGTQVITRTTGKRLGVISQLWVDVDRQEVVALSIRPNLFYGTPQPMMLSSIRQVGDVILVDDENALEDVDLDGYSNLINSEVITETGELLGKVRGFRLNIDSGKVDTLTIASIGLPLIPDQIVSTYELPIDEIVSSGPDRLIVYEGAEERMSQVSVGILERLGIGKPPWERDESEQYLAPIRTENQLPSGVRTPIQTQVRQPVEETWNEDNWGEPEPLPLRQEPPRRKAEMYYENEEEDNWSAATSRDSYEEEEYDEDYDDEDDYVTEAEFEEVREPEVKFDDPEEDPWKDQDEEPYTPQELKIPEKVKQPEYEEEGY
ncbi:MAG: PRC-barrel domain-containing protein [Phormidesmis sp. CAN_BIN44]|nr:PRC-barrel domain-containing protein [Phormidesmis sp. CAN_BIN44]